MSKLIQVSWCVAVAGCLLGAGCSETTARGPRGEKLTVYKPSPQEIDRGDTETVVVKLHRENIDDPVRVAVTQLPSGVDAVDSPQATRSDEVEIVLRASPYADLVANHLVMLTAEGPDGLRVTETFPLTVSKAGDRGD